MVNICKHICSRRFTHTTALLGGFYQQPAGSEAAFQHPSLHEGLAGERAPPLAASVSKSQRDGLTAPLLNF